MKKTFISLCILLIVVISIVTLRAIYLSVDTNAPTWLMQLKMENIIEKYGRKISDCNIISVDEARPYFEFSNTTKKKFEKISDDKKVVEIDIIMNSKQYREPNEIFAVMDAYQWLRERQLIQNVCGFVCNGCSDSFNDACTTLAVISVEELEEIYLKCISETEETDLKILVEEWIKSNYYFRDGLEDNSGFQGLLSTSNRYVLSPSKKYQLGYLFDKNVLSVSKIDRSENNGVVVEMLYTIFRMDINETGWLYCAWDEEDNIWLLGEFIGFQKLKHTENDLWIIDEAFDYNKIPEVLLKVIKTGDGSVSLKTGDGSVSLKENPRNSKRR